MSWQPKRHLLAPALWLAWCVLVTWAYLPALDGPPPLERFTSLPELDASAASGGLSLDLLSIEPQSPAEMLLTAAHPTERLLPNVGPRARKMIGLALHILSGCLLYLLSMQLFSSMGAPRARWPAFSVAALWLSLPLLMATTIHTAYTETALRGALGLVALLAYSRGRDGMVNARISWPWFATCIVAAVLSGLSIGNLLFLLPLLALIEVFVYRFRGLRFGERHTAYAALAAIVVPLLAVFASHPGVMLEGHALREVTLVERALGGARILFDYGTQVLWVDVHSLGLYHDDAATFLKWSAFTTAAVAGCLLLIVVIVFRAVSGRARLPALGLSLFLVGQLMETGAVPPELYLEQRNYLPAFGLLLALVSGATALRLRWPVLGGWPGLLLALLLSRNLLLLGSQAVIWSEDYLLHVEAENNHPNSRRTRLELAYRLAEDGNLEGALRRLAVDEATTETVVLGALFHCLASRRLPEGHFSGVSLSEATLKEAPIDLYVAHLSRKMLAGECAEGDVGRLANALEGRGRPGN